MLSLPGNSVFSSVHRDWELGEEGLLSWHSDHLSWRSAFPRHGSSLLSPPRQSALLTCSILQPPTSCFPPMSFMHADASSCLLSHRAHLKDNFPEVYQEQLKDGSVMVFGQGFYKHLNPSLGQLTYYVQAQNTVKHGPQTLKPVETSKDLGWTQQGLLEPTQSSLCLFHLKQRPKDSPILPSKVRKGHPRGSEGNSRRI